MTEKALGDGYFLRFAAASYVNEIEIVVGNSFTKPNAPPNPQLGSYWRRIATDEGKHPEWTEYNTLIVIHRDNISNTEKVVANTSVWEEEMVYEGINFTIARLEIVGVLFEHRGKNLIRHLFEEWHHYYRQFGYEYALEGNPPAQTWFSAIPALALNEVEDLECRPAKIEDIEDILQIAAIEYKDLAIYNRMKRKWLERQIHSHEDRITYNLPAQYTRRVFSFIDSDGQIAAYAEYTTRGDPTAISMLFCGIRTGVCIEKAVPSMLRGILSYVKEDSSPENYARKTRFEWWPSMGPAFMEALPPTWVSPVQSLPHEYTKYVRVNNLANFVTALIPALNTRLERSLRWGSYTGSVKTSNYSTKYPGLELSIDRGKVIKVSEFAKSGQDLDENIGYFPGKTFLQVLFGRRSILELHHILPDVSMNDNTLELLSTLFPKTKTRSYSFY
ncbi:hypothetical protein NQZ79_g4590 [Umbelopsis isabellina]|nr:hypothetical protein NQZ79_g4590 [Umbelopsis isabellina]